MRFVRRSIRFVIMQLNSIIRLRKAQLFWLKNNKHNKTRMGNYFPADRVNVGRFTYGELTVHHFDAVGEGLEIGDYCSIGPDVEFFLGGEHHPKYVSNYPFSLYFEGLKNYEHLDRTTKGKIIIDNDVWIGAHSLIMSGVHIGQGAIIGAGSIVTKDVPPYAIFAGGRIVKKRFDDKTIEKLMRVDFSKMNADFIKSNVEYFYTEDIDRAIDSIINGEKRYE